MEAIVEWLIAYSFRASLLCFATLLLLAAFKSASASVRSGMVFAGTVGAIFLPISVGILPPISLSEIFAEPVSKSIPLEGISPVADSRVGLVGHEVAPEVLDSVGMTEASLKNESSSLNWINVLGWVWMVGVVVSLFVLAGRIIAMMRLRSGSSKLPECHPLTAEANVASVQVRFGKSPDVRISEKINVPSAIGLGLKTIMLPQGFAQLDASARKAVLIHECAHLRRRDSLVQVLISLCRCLHWFNPLFLALDRAFNAEAEKACDDQVIGSGTAPDAYSEVILHYYQTVASGNAGAVWNSSASGFYPFPQLDRKLRGRKRMIVTRVRRMVDPAARRSTLGAMTGWFLVGTASLSASVLGALVFVPDYEWRYQLAKRSLPFSDQLVACWRMDEIHGSETSDSGTRRFHGMVGGGTLDEHGRLDQAIYLDGDDFVDMGERFGGLNFPITLTAWVRADSDPTSASQNVVWLGGSGSDKYIYIGLNRRRPAIKSRNGEMAVVLGKPDIADGQWHHLAGVFESESRRLLYLDGKLVAEDTRFAEKPATFSLQIGRNGRKEKETSYIQGAVDDVRVYSASLDSQSIVEIMKGDFSLVAARKAVR